MGMEIVPDKIAEEKKEKDNENNKKIKDIEKWEKGNISTEIGAKIDINELHEKLGHPEEEVTKIDGKLYEIENQGKIGKLWKLRNRENEAEKRA